MRFQKEHLSVSDSAMQDQNDWQKALARAFTRVEDLLEYLELTPKDFDQALDFNSPFRFIVTREFASRMKKKDPRDPLLLQVLPLAIENEPAPGYSTDPLDEKKYNPVPGLLHKYSSRVLLTLTPSCPINCRYCFRRHFAYEDNQITAERLEKIVEYIRSKPEINEVILSGGEPLLLKDEKLREIIRRLETVEHLTTLRVHTRMPVVLPERMTASLLNILTASRLIPVMVIHANHPNEIDQAVAEKLQTTKKTGVLLLHQAVLLKNVNYGIDILKNLIFCLFENGVLPYYVHLLDPVSGISHFGGTGHQDIKMKLAEIFPGYLVPKFVKEIAGKASKTTM